jgi:pimeloyl-ACP methyl ester carboxylesterase
MTFNFELIDSFKVKDIINQRLRFQLPLSYSDREDSRTISVVVNITQKYDESLHSDLYKTSFVLPETPKLICYVQGGPGFPCSVPLSSSDFTKVLLDKGYQVLFLDQRGTGLSTPLEARTFKTLVSRGNNESDSDYTKRQLEYILNFRADSIVEDYEAIRRILIGNTKWSLLGQSYGGFTSFTYLSKYSTSLKDVLVTGGVPPINYGPDDVYRSTYERTAERNQHYYDKYPGDVVKVKNILSYLANNTVTLPNGGNLSVERFQQLGLNFGRFGGTDSMHMIVMKFDYELKLFNYPSYDTLNTIQNESSFDTNIIYALFQEAIYCDGNNLTVQSSDWSADRLRYLPDNHNFVYKRDSEFPTYFTGEMVYKSMYDDFSELRGFKDLAFALHSNTDWTPLYDADTLGKLTWDKVKIVAATYVYDQYVDFDLTNRVKKNVFKNNGNLRQYITSEFFHGGIRANAEKVVGSLIGLLECEVD